MWQAVADEPLAVVFVSDRHGPALRRREHCLKLAGIPCTIDAERRPSGTYYKLCVRSADAVGAHLALQTGGHGRSVHLRESQPTFLAALRDIARTMWDEATLLWQRVLDLVRNVAPLLLGGPDRTP